MNPSNTPSIEAEALAHLEEAMRVAQSSGRDPALMREACARMDGIREDIRREHGTLDIGVGSIRDLRDV